MKKTILASMVLCLSLAIAGCTDGQQQSLPSEEKTSNTAVSTETGIETSTVVFTESETSEQATPEPSNEATPEPSKETSVDAETIAEVDTGTHKVTIVIDTLERVEEAGWEYTSIAPRLIVDGKEATEINASLSAYIQEEYGLEWDGKYVDGWSTQLSSWGVKDNLVSLVIYAKYTSEDYSTREAFNFDLDTLTAMEDSEVTKCLGMTDQELFDKTAEIMKVFCAKREFNLEKSLALINYDKITPFVMEDGTPGVMASVVYPDDSQFAGSETMCMFNLTTME